MWRMKFVVTLMVRDEVDVIAAMIEHTLDQQPDIMIVTDNGSVDGTTEVLQRYADLSLIELQHDPAHRKQQHSVVTAMARRARSEFAADWVVNADADEFWVPQDKGLTLRTALERTPLSLNAFTVPVTNLIGRGRCSPAGRKKYSMLCASKVFATMAALRAKTSLARNDETTQAIVGRPSMSTGRSSWGDSWGAAAELRVAQARANRPPARRLARCTQASPRAVRRICVRNGSGVALAKRRRTSTGIRS